MKEVLVIKDLGDICHFQNGFAFKSKTFKEFGEPVVRITNIQNDRVESKGFVFVDRNDYSQDLSKYEVRKGDLLIAMSGATTGKIGLYRSEKILLLNQRVGLFKPNQSLDKQYLYYFLSTKVEESLAISAGAAQPNLSTEQIKAFQIPLPPFPEQQRIVSILDKAFAAIDQAKANAEQNLKNAKELFESYLQGVFENGDWETSTIQEITRVINGYAFKSKDFKPTHSVKSIKITNVGVKEFVEETDNYLPEEFGETLNKVQVKDGDIVIALTRTIIAAGLKVAVVPATYDGALVNQRVAALVANEENVRPSYLYYYLTTKGVADYVLAHVNTLMQPNLSINDLKTLPVPLPSTDEQENIVSQLDSMQSETQKMEAIYQKKIDDLEELKKSILQKAFAGELKVSELGFDGLKDDMILEKDKT
jgi:type I restriction enzyme S subunit